MASTLSLSIAFLAILKVASGCDYFEEDGFNYIGNDVAPTILNITFDDCWDECETNQACFFISHGSDDISCRQMSSDSGRVADSDFKSAGCREESSFPVTTEAPEVCDEYEEKGWRYSSPRIGDVIRKVKSVDACWSHCLATEGCNFVSWGNWGYCVLRAADTGRVKDSRYRSKGCRNKSIFTVPCDSAISACPGPLPNNPDKCTDDACPYYTESSLRYNISNTIANGFHSISDVPTAEDCLAKCKERQGECKFFTFIKWFDIRGCYLLSSDAGKHVGHMNDVSGGLQCYREDRACPVSWLRINNICIKMGFHPRKYEDSARYCSAIGGQLYEPRCEDTDEQVRAYAQTVMDIHTSDNVPARGPWMGINDSKQEGSWVYRSDKMPVKFTNWGTNEPHGQPGSDQHTGQDCGYLVAAGNNDQGQGMWGDYICHSKQYQMCEMPAN